MRSMVEGVCGKGMSYEEAPLRQGFALPPPRERGGYQDPLRPIFSTRSATSAATAGVTNLAMVPP